MQNKHRLRVDGRVKLSYNEFPVYFAPSFSVLSCPSVAEMFSPWVVLFLGNGKSDVDGSDLRAGKKVWGPFRLC